jgi:hypothetical protein
MADVPSVYRGDTTNATLTISGTPTSDRRTLTANPTNALLTAVTSLPAPLVKAFDLIRFGGRGPWYELPVAPSPLGLQIRLLGSSTSGSVDYEQAEDLGYVLRNTPWPAEAVPLSLTDGGVIDLFWSGFGPLGGAYNQFSTLGQRITLLFDGTGRLRQIVGSPSPVTGSPRWVPTGPVFLLVGRIDRAGQPSAVLNPADDSVGANWQYPDSYWIAIDVQSGVCKTAECKPNAVSVIDSQVYIRQALLKGGQ